MKLELIPISQLIEDPSNVRTHSDKNINAIKGSLKRFKQQKPIVIDKDNIIIAGNGTIRAAKDAGLTEIYCVRSELQGTDKTAFAIADNRTSELAEWDKTALGLQLSALDDLDFDLEEIGFDVGDMTEFELPESSNGKEFDESCADDVEFIECPECHHKWPK